MKKVAMAIGIVVIAVAGYLGYKYWQVQQLAARYKTAKEVASASLQKNGAVWTMELTSVFTDPVDTVWKAMKHPERSAELNPEVFQKSQLVKDEGNHKTVDFQVRLLSLPSQGLTADLTYDDSAHVVKVDTSKGMQEVHATYELTPLGSDKTLLTYAGTAEEKVTLPVPQSFVENALTALFVAQMRVIQQVIHGKAEKAVAKEDFSKNEVKICEGPTTPETPKVVTIEIAQAGSEAAPPAQETRKETADGYERVYLVDGVPVKEVYDVKTTCTTAVGIVGGLKVQIQSVILIPASLEPWVRGFKWSRLSSVKPGPEGKIGEDQLEPLMPEKPRGWEVVPPMMKPKLANPLTFLVYEQFLT